MERCSVYCITKEKDFEGDVLERTDKRIRVVLDGTDLAIVMTRSDFRQPYTGRVGAVEFETFGELEE